MASLSTLKKENLLMKIAALIARILLGLMFLVFGLNGFLNFMGKQPPMPGMAGQFAGALIESHYMQVVAALMVISGVLFLVNRYVPLALILIGPVIFNILLFHIFMAPSTIGMGLVAAVLWFIIFFSVRSAFAGIFLQKA
jgi:putative oxidoreductase